MKKKILSVALIVLAIAIVGTSLAYFTDTKTAKNVITTGNIKITLDEAAVIEAEDGSGCTTWTATADRVEGNSYGSVYPGAILPKDPIIHNVGKNPAYVRLVITVENGKQFASAGEAIFENVDAKWTKEADIKADGENLVIVYDYNEILVPGADTTALFTAINVPATAAALADFNVSIVAEAIQAESFANAAAAWAAFAE